MNSVGTVAQTFTNLHPNIDRQIPLPSGPTHVLKGRPRTGFDDAWLKAARSEAQEKWHGLWRGQVEVARTVADAFRAVGLKIAGA